MFNFQVKNDVQARLNQSANTSSEPRPAVYKVKNGDTVSGIAKKYGMSVEQFKQWTGLKNTNLQIGQKINLPQATVPKGKGITTLCDNYKMDFEAFCKLNNIPKPYKNYQAKAEEKFYVFNGFGKNKTSTEQTAPVKPETTAPTSSEVKYKVQSGDTVEVIAKKFNTTQEHIKELAGIWNPRQLQAGQELALPSIKVTSGMTADGICKKYNMTLMQFKALNPHIKSLNKLSIGQTVYVPVKPFEKVNAVQSTGNTTISSDIPRLKIPNTGFISVPAGKTHDLTVSSGQLPLPVQIDGNGKEKVVPEVIKYEPAKNNSGKLKDKVIMVNAGHGYPLNPNKWGNYIIDPGKDGAKDINGRKIDEWRKNRDFCNVLVEYLRAEGATVIFTSGRAEVACKSKKKYECDLFVSIHCNTSSRSSAQGLQVYYDEKDKKGPGKELANITAEYLGIDEINIKSDITTYHGRLGVLKDIGPKYAPSICMEMGYMTNETDLKNIDSKDVREKQMGQLTQAIVETLNPEAAEQ